MKKITLTGPEALDILSEVEYLGISLRNISRHYCQIHDDKIIHEEKYHQERTYFINYNNIKHRLAKIRKIVSENFSYGFSDDDMDNIEREMEKLKYWTKPKE